MNLKELVKVDTALTKLQTVSGEYRKDLMSEYPEFIYLVIDYVVIGSDVDKAIEIARNCGKDGIRILRRM